LTGCAGLAGRDSVGPMQGYFVGILPDDQWHPLLNYYLAATDSFLIHMPDGDSMLSAGREQFRSLPGVSIHPWDGMRDAIEIAGELSPRSRELFTSIEASIHSFEHEKKLWDYRLLRDRHPALSISDFSDLLIWPTGTDRTRLAALGVSSHEWQPM
jgi:hypothetical protein